MELKLTLRLLTNEDRIFGPGVAELLERVREHHSLRSAAASMEMAYSKAWRIVRAAEEGMGCKLLSSSTGGRHGGGASLTPEAERLLTAYRPAGVVHCFSGSVEMMREVVRLGMSIGLGGVVTFKNARRPVEVAAAVPGDRLLLETDAPYMAPVPFRGKRCDSSMIAHTAARIAEIRETTVEALLEQTAANTRRLFRLD